MKIKRYLPVIGIIIFLYILLSLDITNIIKEISQAKLYFLLIALLFSFFTLVTQTLKWFSIARIQSINIPFLKAFKINLMASFYAFITPSKIGNIMRADYLKKYSDGKIGKGVSNYVLDKILDLFSLVLLAAIFTFGLRDVIPLKVNPVYYVIALVGFIIFIIIIRDKNISKMFLGVFYRRLIPNKFKKKAKEEFHSFYEDMPKKRYFLLFFVLNILNWIVLYITMYFVGKSLGVDVPFFSFLAIMPITTLVAQIPITISGLGTREAVMISLFGFLGISAVKIFSMSMVNIFIGLIPLMVGGFFILKNKERA